MLGRLFKSRFFRQLGVCRVGNAGFPGLVPQLQHTSHGDVYFAGGGVVHLPAKLEKLHDLPVHLHRGNSCGLVQGLEVHHPGVGVVDVKQLVVACQGMVDCLRGFPESLLRRGIAHNGGHRVEKLQKGSLVPALLGLLWGAAPQKEDCQKKGRKPLHLTLPGRPAPGSCRWRWSRKQPGRHLPAWCPG